LLEGSRWKIQNKKIHVLFKQQLRKQINIMSPNWPRMTASVFAVFVFDTHILKFFHHYLAIGMGNILFSTL
jgi:hypothetical protein